MLLPRVLRRCNNEIPRAMAISLQPILSTSPVTTTPLRIRTTQAAPFTTTTHALANRKTQMPSRPKPPPEEEIHEVFLKGSGPGGQKINKTNSAVQLKHIPTGIVVKCQETRSRDSNRKIARNLLAQQLDILHNGDQSRWSIVGDDKKKRADSAAKKSKRKYKKIAEEKEAATAEVVEEEAVVAQQQQQQHQQPQSQPEVIDQTRNISPLISGNST